MIEWLLGLVVAGILVFLAVFLALGDAAYWIGRRGAALRRRKGPDGLPARHLFVHGRRRSYHLYVPPALQGRRDVPLVLAFHGGGGYGLRFRDVSRFDEVAERFGFVVAYPNAVRYWNDGRDGTRGGPDDVAFAGKLIRHLVRKRGVDPKRVYATGQSNGGLLALRLACELSDRIAAFAPVLASLPVEYRDRCRPKRPLPILFINGTADQLIPWDGGRIPAGSAMGAGGQVLSVPDTIRFWRTHNGCEDAPTLQRVQDRDRLDGVSAELLRFRNCREGADLAMIKIRGGGHAWPGTHLRPMGRRAEVVGDASYDFDASLVIWKFFEGRTLP